MGYVIAGVCGLVLGIVLHAFYVFRWKNKDLRESLRVTRADLGVATRKAEEYFGVIEGIEQERNRAHSILDQSNAEHGAAQDMMMREIQSVAIQYSRRATQILKALDANDLDAVRTAAATPLRASREVARVAEEFGLRYGTKKQEPLPPVSPGETRARQ